uniref:Ankyrin repeat domain-containing protein 27-like n=1 Tax=Cicer arietinum TaxID=3827 RepID=A0A1S2YLN8_CICAR|nr:ankyrin repeat domain-containing protein 27-like [Cicer arietinum]
MTHIEEGDYANTDTTELEVKFCWQTLQGNRKEVEKLYELDVKFSTININESRGTALHVAVNEGNQSVVGRLVNSILFYGNVVALKTKNEKGDTPLHLAASQGFQEICECIIGKNGERTYLNYIHNEKGETPLFLALLSWQK